MREAEGQWLTVADSAQGLQLRWRGALPDPARPQRGRHVHGPPGRLPPRGAVAFSPAYPQTGVRVRMGRGGRGRRILQPGAPAAAKGAAHLGPGCAAPVRSAAARHGGQ